MIVVKLIDKSVVYCESLVDYGSRIVLKGVKFEKRLEKLCTKRVLPGGTFEESCLGPYQLTHLYYAEPQQDIEIPITSIIGIQKDNDADWFNRDKKQAEEELTLQRDVLDSKIEILNGPRKAGFVNYKFKQKYPLTWFFRDKTKFYRDNRHIWKNFFY